MSDTYKDNLQSALVIEGKTVSFKTGLRVLLAVNGVVELDELTEKINALIAERKKSDIYNDSFTPFNTAITRRWVNTGALYNSERRYMPLLCEALNIHPQSNDYLLVFRIAAETNTLWGKVRRLRKSYILQHQDGFFDDTSRSYLGDYLYKFMQAAEMDNSELAEVMGITEQELEIYIQGKAIVAIEPLARFAALIDLRRDPEYAAAIEALLNADKQSHGKPRPAGMPRIRPFIQRPQFDDNFFHGRDEEYVHEQFEKAAPVTVSPFALMETDEGKDGQGGRKDPNIYQDSGYEIRRIYGYWYIKNNPAIITDEDKDRYNSDSYIIAFIRQFYPEHLEYEDSPGAKASSAIASFKKAIDADPQRSAQYYAYYKTSERQFEIDYSNLTEIKQFIADLKLGGLVATERQFEKGGKESVVTVHINEQTMQRILYGALPLGVFLQRYIQIMVRSEIPLSSGQLNFRTSINAKSHQIDIDKGLIPKIGIVADTLWAIRIERKIASKHVNESIGLSGNGNLFDLEIGENLPKPRTLLALLNFYNRRDLYSNPAFMAPLLEKQRSDSMHKADKFGLQLRLKRWEKGLTAEEVDDLTEAEGQQISRYENEIRSPSPASLKKICEVLNWDMDEAITLLFERFGYNNTLDKFGYELTKKRYLQALEPIELDTKIGAMITSDCERGGSRIPRNFVKLCKGLNWDKEEAFALLADSIGVNKLDDFGKKLVQKRWFKGLNQTELGGLIGIDGSILSKLELNRASIKPANLTKLSKELDWDIGEAVTLLFSRLKFEREANPFGYEVRFRRWKKGLELGELATLSGRDRHLISNCENGHNPPGPATLQDLCRALDWDVADATSILLEMESKRGGQGGFRAVKPKDAGRSK